MLHTAAHSGQGLGFLATTRYAESRVLLFSESGVKSSFGASSDRNLLETGRRAVHKLHPRSVSRCSRLAALPSFDTRIALNQFRAVKID